MSQTWLNSLIWIEGKQSEQSRVADEWWEGQVRVGGGGKRDRATGLDCTCQHIWGKALRAQPYTDISKRACAPARALRFPVNPSLADEPQSNEELSQAGRMTSGDGVGLVFGVRL